MNIANNTLKVSFFNSEQETSAYPHTITNH